MSNKCNILVQNKQFIADYYQSEDFIMADDMHPVNQPVVINVIRRQSESSDASQTEDGEHVPPECDEYLFVEKSHSLQVISF